MHSIKIISLSLALLFSCSSFSSAPAQAAQPNDDELKIQEIPLVPIKKAMSELAWQTEFTQNFLKYNSTFDKKLTQDMHQAECAITNLIAHKFEAAQHIDEHAQNGEDVSTQMQQFQALGNQIDERLDQEHILMRRALANNKSVEIAYIYKSQRNLYWYQAVSLRAEKEEEKIKHEKEKIKMEEDKIKMETQINQLQEKLKQYEPGFQPQMEEQIEGMPLVPGGAK